MAGSRWPFPWEPGRVQSLRADLHRKPCSEAQRDALACGEDVTFSAAWLASHYPPGHHPAAPDSFAAAPVWVLRGDDTLVPVVG